MIIPKLITPSAVLAALTLLSVTACQFADEKEPSEYPLADVVSEIERLNDMRSTLALSFGQEGVTADKDTFQKVCKPVGKEMKRVAEENGWKIVQMAEKYRNPSHKLDEEAHEVFSMMQEDKELMGRWEKAEMNGQKGIRYFRRITVESSCLKCHGEKERRPEFVKKGYPGDKAFGFKEGDLRGVYSVFIPHDTD